MTDIALDEKALEAAAKALRGDIWETEPNSSTERYLADLRQQARDQAEEAIRAYLRSSPAQVAPAYPAQMTDAVVEALVLMVDAFLSRNGGSFPMDEVTKEQRLWKKAMKAAYAVIGQPRTRERDEKLAALTAAIGAGGQAVALPPITDRGLAGQIMDAAWPEFGGDLQTAEFWNDFGTGVEFTLKALPQPHPADERVVEALEVTVPKEPSRGRLISMAIRDNHAFLINPDPNAKWTSGVRPEHRESILRSMRQLYEEAIGEGFYSPEKEQSYIDSFERSMPLPAAPSEQGGDRG